MQPSHVQCSAAGGDTPTRHCSGGCLHVLPTRNADASAAVSTTTIMLASNCAVQVVNCVGLINYKFFIQFLLYTFIATLVAIACLIRPMLVFFSGTPGGRWVGHGHSSSSLPMGGHRRGDVAATVGL